MTEQLFFAIDRNARRLYVQRLVEAGEVRFLIHTENRDITFDVSADDAEKLAATIKAKHN